MITGATNPTGIAFAERFARQGFKLILVAENDDAQCEQLKQTYPGCEVLVFDFGRSADSSDYVSLCNHIKTLAQEMNSEISVLVNNVSKMDPRFGEIRKASDGELVSTVNANVCPSIYMTRLLGAQMKKQGNKCAIINMSSIYCLPRQSDLLKGEREVGRRETPQESLPIFTAGAASTSYMSQVVAVENEEMDVMTVLA